VDDILSPVIFVVIITVVQPFLLTHPAQVSTNTPRIPADFSWRIGMPFEQNIGQFSPEILFMATDETYTVFVTATGPIFSVRYSLPEPTATSPSTMAAPNKTVTARPFGPEVFSGHAEFQARIATSNAQATVSARYQRQWTIRMTFLGANPHPTLIGEDQQRPTEHYWQRLQVIGQPSPLYFERVHFADLYNGIHLTIYANAQRVRTTIEIAPGADATQLRYRIEGADHLALDTDGKLLIYTGEPTLSPFLYKAPFAYQLVDGVARTFPVSSLLTPPP